MTRSLSSTDVADRRPALAPATVSGGGAVEGGAALLAATARVIATGVGKPLERRRLSEQVAGELEQLIVSGRLRPGETLPSERELMRLFGVGRTSIREALFALQRKGVVSAQPGLRPVVSSPNADVIVSDLSSTVRLFLSTATGLREFQLVRRMFEPPVARLAAQRGTAEDLSRVRSALLACEAALGDPVAYAVADVSFHFAIVQATHSSLLIALHRAVLDWLHEQRTVSVEPPGAAKAAHRAHARIEAAIAARDGAGAERAMLEHLEEVERFFWQARESGPPTHPNLAARPARMPT